MLLIFKKEWDSLSSKERVWERYLLIKITRICKKNFRNFLLNPYDKKHLP